MNKITIPLKNSTGLDANHSIYVAGFSSTSKKMLQVSSGTTGKFVDVPTETGALPLMKLGTDITEIAIDATSAPVTPKTTKIPAAHPINGARIYFFVVDSNVEPKAVPPITFTNHGSKVVNVPNPPNKDVPPYTFTEFTLVETSYGAVIDIQTVDGFVFPITIELNDKLGQIGQPATMTRAEILAAYTPFINALPDANKAYFGGLAYSENKGGLLNPGAYLNEMDANNQFSNLTSELNRLFDDDLNKLFNNDNLCIQGVSGTNIDADLYTAKSGDYPLPGTSSTHQGLKFTGAKLGKEYVVFNPVGLCVLTYETTDSVTKKKSVHPIAGTIKTFTLTFTTPLPPDTPLIEGMYVKGAGLGTNIRVQALKRNNAQSIVSVDLVLPLENSAAGSSYAFSTAVQKTQYNGTVSGKTLAFTSPLPAAAALAKGMDVQGVGQSDLATISSITLTADQNNIASVELSAAINQPASGLPFAFWKPVTPYTEKGTLTYDAKTFTNTITFAQPVPATTPLAVGMKVEGPGASKAANICIASLVKNVAGDVTAVTVTQNLENPATNSQYQFSKTSAMFYTSGNMTLANQGVFAFAEGIAKDEQPILLNLQNQIVAAFNRGVANLGPTAQPDPQKPIGYTSLHWGTQSNWYPEGTAQNLFSLFMHTAKSKGTPIFMQDPKPALCARNTAMGQAYGFAYDENAGPNPPVPNQPEVPSKYDPLPQAVTTVTITLGPWA